MQSELNLDFVLIPDGEFVIGSNPSADRLAQTDESPQHRLHITDYYMMRYPVTNAQYRLFIKLPGTGCRIFGRMASFRRIRPTILWWAFLFTMRLLFVNGPPK